MTLVLTMKMKKRSSKEYMHFAFSTQHFNTSPLKDNQLH